MNANHIINMILRRVIGQLINRGVTAGFEKAADLHDRRKAARGEPVKDPADQTPAERRQQRQARQQARRARQQVKAVRRAGKF